MTLHALGLGCTRGGRELFRALDLRLEPGDALRVAGANGAGKTSLLRILAGLAQPDTGTVSWNGSELATQRDQFNADLTYLGHLNGLKDDLTPCENLLYAVALRGLPADAGPCYRALERAGVGALADRPCRTLSMGQKKRVALARLDFEVATPLWILDEPLASLDPDAQLQLTDTIDRHLAGNGMLIYSTHQPLTLHSRSHGVVNLDRPC